MTDQQQPEPDLGDAFNHAIKTLAPAIKQARDAFQTASAGVLAAVQAARLPLAAGSALDACLLGDDDTAREALAGLDAEQLHRIENAAVALSLHASRLRSQKTH